jgi:hypothetical protein
MYQGIPLKYFMWAHQHSTQENIQRYAEELFEAISPKLKPNLLLLGILRKELEGKHPICIQPENCGVDVIIFNGIDNLAKSIWEKDPRRNVLHGMPYIHENYHNQVKRDSVRRAVQEILDENFEGKNVVSFVSQSVELEGYEVFVVLQFDESVYNSFYRLFGTGKYDRISLFDSLIWIFLQESLDTLYRPRAATAPQSIKLDKKEIFRLAASDFVGSAIFSVCGTSFPWEFLETCNFVSSLKYEGDSSIGNLIVSKENHPNVDVSLKLIKPVDISEYKKVRKLLEIASRDLALHSNGKVILGLGKIKGEYEKNQDLLLVNFTGPHKWELNHGGQKTLIVEYTNPRLPKQKVNREVFDELLKRTFLDISDENIGKLWNFVDTATMQKHGALLIISSEAEGEALRLENQSTRIEPTMLNDSLIRNVTSIDGAVLLDTKGICHSIGVILDGIATSKGTSERGARFNSAVRYVENNRKKCIAIIISEDGMVDLYPVLLPKIRKSEIEEHLGELRSVSSQKILDDDKYRDLMSWFFRHEFYLSQDHCNEINKIKMECNEKERKDIYQVLVYYPDLKSNPDMEDSYFLEEE